ncbi:hypothetical protein HPP92_029178 [Vanilla planifolia]|uniref:Uncharacterized protein n=1 Tax=Vanilla planifolia TaxID=51239 RepID=A0A835U1B3_VANPL|nr:hypothetical protein HPP92_029178 [Vanilla planifolia]KAG0445775.1 hypothetical protein HPP92_029165 [Vanilla planifolia]
MEELEILTHIALENKSLKGEKVFLIGTVRDHKASRHLDYTITTVLLRFTVANGKGLKMIEGLILKKTKGAEGDIVVMQDEWKRSKRGPGHNFKRDLDGLRYREVLDNTNDNGRLIALKRSGED